MPHPPGAVTAENFHDLAIAWLRSGPTEDGAHHVVRMDRDWPAWVAWTTFLRRLGLRYAFAERLGVLTVPATFPWDFSMDADDLRDVVFDVERPRADPPISVERRRELATMLRGIMPREMRRAGPAKRRGYDPDTPVTVSPELLRKMGAAS